MLSNKLDVLSTPTIASGPCKQNVGCTKSAFICRLSGPGSWYVASSFPAVISGPGGEYTVDITDADPESGLNLPDEEDTVVALAPSSDAGDEIRVSCILKY
jgi:hypothetical protein